MCYTEWCQLDKIVLFNLTVLSQWRSHLDIQLKMSSRIGIMLYNIWAATCDYQQCGSFEGEDSKQPPYLLTVIRNLNFSFMDHMASKDGWYD